MDALVTLLSPDQDARVRSIWAELASECGLSGIEATPVPHFSWGGAHEIELHTADQVLTAFSDQVEPFVTPAGGLGLFLKPEPVVFIPVVKTPKLLALHGRLWDQLGAFSSVLSPYYSPEAWMPHITLAQWNLTVPAINCAIETIFSIDLSMEIAVDNLAVIRQREGTPGTLSSVHRFGA